MSILDSIVLTETWKASAIVSKRSQASGGAVCEVEALGVRVRPLALREAAASQYVLLAPTHCSTDHYFFFARFGKKQFWILFLRP